MAAMSVSRALLRRGLSSASAVGRHRPVMKFDEARPELANDCFVAPNATVVGNVQLCVFPPRPRPFAPTPPLPAHSVRRAGP